MLRPTIAIDCDDVVAWTNERFGTNLTVADYTDHWSLLWQVDHDETEQYANEYHAEGRHRTFTHKPSSNDILKELSESYNLVVVTARRKEIVKTSLEWIEEKFPGVFSDVRFVPIWEVNNTITKADICREIGATYLIDDLPRHCNVAAEAGITGLLFGDYGWNRNEAVPYNVHRVKDWQGIREFFRNAA